jgi:hypothetical protein
MAHTVSINEIPSHQFNIIVKSIKFLQFQCISHRYVNTAALSLRRVPEPTAVNKVFYRLHVGLRHKDRGWMVIQGIKKGALGVSVAHVFTIEFQKRGLPHMHLIIFLHHDSKLKTAEDINFFSLQNSAHILAALDEPGIGLCDTIAPSTVMWTPIYGRLGTVIHCISFVD